MAVLNNGTSEQTEPTHFPISFHDMAKIGEQCEVLCSDRFLTTLYNSSRLPPISGQAEVKGTGLQGSTLHGHTAIF